ncbi:MAG: helix-turn-helix domain-containing protein [Bacteroidales bacterium]|nr:helix-turn-helix domain-containing protein [Bacteroidales bacterium]
MMKFFPLRRICRLLPPVAFVVLIILGVVLGDGIPDISCICAYLSATGVMMVFCPLSHEDAVFSLGSEVFALVCVLVAVCIFHGQYLCLLQAVLAISISLPVVFSFILSRRKFRHLQDLFQPEALQDGVEDYARFFYMMLVPLLTVLVLLAVSAGAGTVPMVLLALVLFCADVLLYLRSRLSLTMLLSPAFERKLKDSVASGVLRSIASRNEDPDRVNSIYGKVVQYMEDVRPYLRDDYSIYDLAGDVGYNRAYISHVINVCYGKNFRQFINGYRVRYSVGLMQENPGLKVVELAVKSGFHSSVSYNMAFKLVMNESPSEYLKKITRS